ncbi:hypothetical protein CRI94_14455 [Longibacter salinarum]|uniref:Primosome assembly protein PriA n=1 Tax=Longibacter salinarum TaxID=1850348 RepID=A0A2A8CUV9_9BACT|nr:TMEM43 family protein [Longibacter salinarum]PEN12238.1 hypothetical protein CRI94_14455 [Longibacter salinarum]
MPDEYTEVTSESWLNRLWDSITGVLFGILIFLVAFPLLFWNEGRAVKTARSLDEGAASVVTTSPDAVDPELDGQLVHVTGRATSDATLTDPIFGIEASALKLRRSVEMYQWTEETSQETQKKLGGSEETVTTYSYSKTWASRPIDSEEFEKSAGHENPGPMPFSEWSDVAHPVTVGAFRLPGSMADGIGSYDDYVPTPDERTAIEAEHDITSQGGTLYSGDPATPQVGDIRVTFDAVASGPVSIVAKQTGDSFEAYQTSNGQTVSMLESGTHSAASMFESAQASNTMWTWGLRGLGILLMTFGLSLVFRPLTVVADVVPFLGNLLETGFGLVSFLIAIPFALVTIALGWIVYRPLVGIGLLVVAAAVVGLVVWMRGRADASSASESPAPSPV